MRVRRPVQLLLIPYLAASVACLDLPGGGSDDPAARQARLVGSASDRLDGMIDRLADLNARVAAAAEIDETLGNEIVRFLGATWVAGFDDTLALLDELEASNLELEREIAQASGFAKRPWFVEILSAAAILAGISAWLLEAGNSAKAKVDTVDRALANSRAQGKTQAQAIAENAPLLKQTIGDLYRDTQLRIAKQSLSPQFHKPPESCAKSAVKLVVNGAKVAKQTKLVGKRKAAPRKAPQETADGIVYLAESSDGNFDSIPTGTWDLVIYGDGYVRGVATDVAIAQCTTAVPIDVEVMTWDEARAGPTPDAGPAAPDAAPAGDFEVLGYRNTDGTIGSGAAGAEIQLSGSRATPTIAWSFAGAITLLVTSSTGSFVYGIIGKDDVNGDPSPFGSPVVYGNYGVANTEPLGQAQSPSPPLASGMPYTITMATSTPGRVATLSFRPR